MQTIQNTSSAIFHLASLLDELSAGCDPDFDTAYDDLDREFAELRCQLGNA
jgi:hypothetical protein